MSLPRLPALAAAALAAAALAAPAAAAELSRVDDAFDNPGALVMYEYVPEGLADDRPLVVVLHGCTEAAADATAAGWNALADQRGFALLYPEQTTANNPLRCFDWAGDLGDTADLERGKGENQSIVAMVDLMVVRHHIDPARVYVTGFSAGGAMTAVLLATWPDRFAAGAIMSGVPYRCATDLSGAQDCQRMDQHPERQHSPDEWAALVRQGDPDYAGPWPRVSLWHGQDDTTVVNIANLGELAEQWTAMHDVASAEPTVENLGDSVHRRWLANGEVVVESYAVAGMGHAITVGAADPAGGCSAMPAGTYYQDHGLCAARRVLGFFGLGDATSGGGDGGPDGQPGGDAGPGDSTQPGGCAAGGSAPAATGSALLLLAALLTVRRRPRAVTRPAKASLPRQRRPGATLPA